MIFVAIPCRGHWREFTGPLVEHLLTNEPGLDAILVMDNASTDETAEEVERLHRWGAPVIGFDCPTDGIYTMWNRAIRYAAADGSTLVLLNNDLALAPGTIGALHRALRSDETLWAVSPNPERRVAEGIDDLGTREVHGSYRMGGLTGWCFALATEHFAGIANPVDGQYEWWYGDDDLFAQITKEGGRMARVLGVGCDHLSEGTARDGTNEWVHEAKVRDEARFRAKWGW